MFGNDIRLHLDIGPGLAGLFLKLDERRNAKLDAIDAKLALIFAAQTKGDATMSELSDALADLGTKVAANTDVDNSAIQLMQGLTDLVQQLSDQVAAAGDVPAAVALVKTFAETVGASNAALAAGVTANTQPAPAPAPEPPVA